MQHDDGLASSGLNAAPAPKSVRPGEVLVTGKISRWMVSEYYMLPEDTDEIIDYSRSTATSIVMTCYRRKNGETRRIDNHEIWTPALEWLICGVWKVVDDEKPSHEQVIDVLTNRLMGAFLTYRYDIDVKPEDLYSNRDKEIIMQQIRWNLRHFLEPLLVGRDLPHEADQPTEAKP